MACRTDEIAPNRPLKETYPQSWQQPLQNSGKADEDDKDFQEVVEPSVTNESVDQVEQDRADDDNNKNIDKDEEHSGLSCFERMVCEITTPNGTLQPWRCGAVKK
jgi:hypothetical protein